MLVAFGTDCKPLILRLVFFAMLVAVGRGFKEFAI
jgi:hypothetical protein